VSLTNTDEIVGLIQNSKPDLVIIGFNPNHGVGKLNRVIRKRWASQVRSSGILLKQLKL